MKRNMENKLKKLLFSHGGGEGKLKIPFVQSPPCGSVYVIIQFEMSTSFFIERDSLRRLL